MSATTITSVNTANKITQIFSLLLERYGPQGWWPLTELKGQHVDDSAIESGYHPGDFSYPKNESQRFEICVGAILTQNTNWLNVEKALKGLYESNNLSYQAILSLSENHLSELIRPSGYYRQKAKKLRYFAAFYRQLGGRIPTREALLSLWGIGPETADSMLLYAYHQPVFVVDAYTKRIFSQLKVMDAEASYESVRYRFESALTRDWQLYQEYHALIVKHAKLYYSKKPWGERCPLGNL